MKLNGKAGKLFLVLSCVVVLATLIYVMSPFRLSRISTSNMDPTIEEGDVVLIRFNGFDEAMLHRGEIVIYSVPITKNGTISSCSRVVGLPGETLNLNAYGLTVNGELVEHLGGLRSGYKAPKVLSKVEQRIYGFEAITFPYVVPTNSYFMIGDNIDRSFDSRYFGSVGRSKIYAKVVKAF